MSWSWYFDVQITERKAELTKLETIDCGKPLEEAVWDIVWLWHYWKVFEVEYIAYFLFMTLCVVQDDVAGCFEYYADLAEGLDAKQKAPVSLPLENFKSYVLKEPIGVVGLITPWYMLLLCVYWLIFFQVYKIYRWSFSLQFHTAACN